MTAGVGSGKTIGFSIAALIEARKTMLDSLHDGPDYQSTCLFIYPRTQCKDQFDEINGIVGKMECELPIWLEMYDWYKKKDWNLSLPGFRRYMEKTPSQRDYCNHL